MRLSFHGADRDVTGSCHLLEAAGKRILIDCGLYQGARDLVQDNSAPFGFDAETIDLVLLTHAHLDHCGRLPLLRKRGFRGEIIATAATFELARIVLLDAAHLQEEAARDRAHATPQATAVQQPLYGVADAQDCIGAFGRTAHYDVPLQLAPGMRVTFFDAGHILGSASLLFELDEAGRTRSLIFSGDLGNAGRPLLRAPEPLPHAEIVVMESTYGDRSHRTPAASADELCEAVAATLQRQGNVLIPSFALERAQEILYVLHQAVASGRLPSSLQVYVDSPLAISATEVFARHPELLLPEVAAQFSGGHDPFQLPGLHFTRERAASIAINAVRSGAVIIAGSGMCTGGRILHHLRHNLARENCSVIFVGYAAGGTLARAIIDGAQNVQVLGDRVHVGARIHTINGFSAHADRDELLAWQRHIAPARTFLVHGEAKTMASFAASLTGTQVEMPHLGQSYQL
jgi:metallo-beta-lactamase family protein